ncbi:MAG: Nif3-like dinuclear metal center hexameric protein [Proteobacteria bacterium]|nr:Nif3-like dinuclear metal center hexameric protein [Pseudomonadota bacterium]
MITRKALEAELATLLAVDTFQDYCPNGLQVEGKAEIRKLATAVTASQAAIDGAIAWGADALLVHHGYFWRNEPASLVGTKGARIRSLMKSDMNLFAYHLPLDAHATLGNNAQLAQLLNIEDDGSEPKRIWRSGSLDFPLSLEGFVERVRRNLRREPFVITGGPTEIRRVAWCSGAAQSYFSQAIEAGIDAFITGEVSESCYHLAHEAGVHFIAAGHHATERFGVQALGRLLATQYDLDYHYIELPNPI